MSEKRETGREREERGAKEREMDRERCRSESQVTATQKQSGGKSQMLEPINSLHVSRQKPVHLTLL